MLSLMPRQGAGGRYRAGARALIVSLAFAALDLSPGPAPARGGVPKSLHLSRSYCQAAPPSLAGKSPLQIFRMTHVSDLRARPGRP